MKRPPRDALRYRAAVTLDSQLFDSHCHLDFDAFALDRDEVWQRARALGVTRVFVPGVSPAGWSPLAELARRTPGMRFGVGLHPFFIEQCSPEERALPELERSFCALGACALGECGLDRGLERRGGPTLTQQLAVFERQLCAAHELRAPIVLHVVGAHGLAVETLERHGALAAGGVLHAYSGSAELVPRYLRLGLSFGFGGGVTRAGAKRAQAALAAVPLNRLLLETDAPDQIPQGFTPPSVNSAHVRRNEPCALALVARVVAERRGLSFEQLAQLTTDNAERLFGRDA